MPVIPLAIEKVHERQSRDQIFFRFYQPTIPDPGFREDCADHFIFVLLLWISHEYVAFPLLGPLCFLLPWEKASLDVPM